ncbi:MAG: hypothetical protein CMH82_06915 [Nocardioides sp.]|nr:hypothetical protein [Nocardioides sp.]|tara:strand:+ start:548 stop:1699 length:1152 start_codon:yes stop_codon:yes gene_type:complete
MSQLAQEASGSLLIVGDGDLGRRVLSILAQSAYPRKIYLGARDEERARLYVNLIKFTAANLGLCPQIEAVHLDLNDVDQTSATIEDLSPDEVLMTASLQSWRRITELPESVFRELDEAQLGPWLPMHLALNYDLMRAVRQLPRPPIVINAAFPDAVGPVLASVGLAPDIGVGNVANIIPGLTAASSLLLGIPERDLHLRLVAHHYFSHYVPRFGEADGVPHCLDAVDSGGRALALPVADVFRSLITSHRRLGGVDGQTLTASSAVRLLHAMLATEPRLVHAPAPRGRVGGYPLVISRDGFALDLPADVTEAQAVSINEAGQVRDGIESIGATGTVRFAGREMSVMQRMLGYHCAEMPLADVHAWAAELGGAYARFVSRCGAPV